MIVNFFKKSSIGGIVMEDRSILNLAMVLNCKTMDVPFSYLGLPVGTNLTRYQQNKKPSKI